MDIQWSMIWTQSNAVAGKARKGQGAFSDPLDRPEWEGLGWSVPFVAGWVSGSRVAKNDPQKIKEVERFTKVAPGKPVCVS